MADALKEALFNYPVEPGTEEIIKKQSMRGDSPESRAEMYAKAGEPDYVGDYLPYTNFNDFKKAKFLITAHEGRAKRFYKSALTAGNPLLRDDYNQRAAAELQQADHLTKLLSQLSPSSG